LINEKIFKAYDIRGIYPTELNEETAFLIGKAIVEYLKCKNIVIGIDMRESSVSLKKSLIQGITTMGCNVIDIDLCTTPMNYYANGFFSTDASVMITASHNPKEYNGFKICRNNAIPLTGDVDLKKIKELCINNDFNEPDEKGTIEKKEIVDEYCKFISNHYHNKDNKKLKIVVDCANAMGALELNALNLENIKIISMYEELDGSFPNHEANPLHYETLKDLQEKVVLENADFGVAFDGDADRCGFVDEKGNIIRNDFITGLIAEDILNEEKNLKIFYDLRSSKIVKEIIENNNGIALMCRVGHSFIKNQMREENAVFAGELSGHFYFKENYNTESSALAVVRIINILLNSNKKISELNQEMQRFYQSGEINKKVQDSKLIIEKIKEKYKDANIFFLDGISVEYKDWWFNIRSSNTEPLLRLNLEANTKELMEEKTKEVLNLYE
jgi:phosphomannomutase